MTDRVFSLLLSSDKGLSRDEIWLAVAGEFTTPGNLSRHLQQLSKYKLIRRYRSKYKVRKGIGWREFYIHPRKYRKPKCQHKQQSTVLPASHEKSGTW